MDSLKNIVTMIFRFSGSGSTSVEEAVKLSDASKEAEIIDDENGEVYSDSESEEDEEDRVDTPKHLLKGKEKQTFPKLMRFRDLADRCILHITSFIPVQLEFEDQLYPCMLFYGYFRSDVSRSLHLIFSSFYFQTDEVNLKSVPFKRVKTIMFEEPVLVNSKYLQSCESLETLINVKINQKTLPALVKCIPTLHYLDFRVYNLQDQTVYDLNQFTQLKNLKLNFRKKLFNRKDVKIRLDSLTNLEILEFWNTSSFQFISIPDSLFEALQKFGKLRSVCFVRVRLKVRHLAMLMKYCVNLEEFEFLGTLTKKHFDAIHNIRPVHLKEINLSGSILEDEFVKIFRLPNLQSINLSHTSIKNVVVLEYVRFPENSQLCDINLNGVRGIPISLIRKLCELKKMGTMSFEKCNLREDHFRMISDFQKRNKTLRMILDDPKWMDEEVVEEIDKLQHDRGNKLVIERGTSFQ